MLKRLWAGVLAVLVALFVGVLSPTAAKAGDDCDYIMGQLSAAQSDLSADYDLADLLTAALDDPETDPGLIDGYQSMLTNDMNVWIPGDSAAVSGYSDQAHAAHCY